jgi:hypothetical protein
MKRYRQKLRKLINPGWSAIRKQWLDQVFLELLQHSPVIRTRTRVHGQKVLNHVLQAELPPLISGVAADTHRFTTCNPDTHNESHSDRANLATRSIVKLH